MKTIALLFVSFSLMAADVRVEWDHDTQPDEGVVTFWLRSSTDATLPLIEWPVIAQTAEKQAAINIEPGKRFFVVQASNFWGLSEFSNVTNTPTIPANPRTIRIHKQ